MPVPFDAPDPLALPLKPDRRPVLAVAYPPQGDLALMGSSPTDLPLEQSRTVAGT